MTNLKKIYAFIFLLTPIISYAGGSTYSRFGLGDIKRYGDSRLYAMSGTGIALIDDGFINGLNPAGMARIAYTRFSSGFEYNRFSSKDEKYSSSYSTGGFQGLSFAIPISTDNGIVLSMESSPFSTVNFATKFSRFDNVIGLTQNQNIYGSGGISNLGLALSGSILNTLHIGGSFSYLYGRTQNYLTSSYESSNFVSAILDETIYYSGFRWTFGIIYEDIHALFNSPSLRNLSIGMTFSAGGRLNAEKQSIYSSIDSIFTNNGYAEIPMTIGFGLSYLMKNNYRILGDIYLENWNNAKQFESQSDYLRNSMRISVGFEKKPLRTADSYLSKLTYRLGAAYHSTYYKVNGVGIDEWIMSCGLGLPIGFETNLNLGLQIGIRGAIENKLQKDTILRFSAAISASEIWFLKFEEE